MTIKRYEFKLLRVTRLYEDDLNAQGANGWQVKSMAYQPQNGVLVILEREIVPIPQPDQSWRDKP